MNLKNFNKSLLINISLPFFIFFIDRISKMYVIYLDKKFLGTKIYSSKFLNINLIWNEGIAFGLLNFQDNNFYNFLTVLILFIILIIIFIIIRCEGLKKYALLMVLGGAMGNVFDRILNKAVPDFIDFHVGNFHWFIFNVADIFITMGVIILILHEIISKSENHKNEIF